MAARAAARGPEIVEAANGRAYHVIVFDTARMAERKKEKEGRGIGARA